MAVITVRVPARCKRCGLGKYADFSDQHGARVACFACGDELPLGKSRRGIPQAQLYAELRREWDEARGIQIPVEDAA